MLNPAAYLATRTIQMHRTFELNYLLIKSVKHLLIDLIDLFIPNLTPTVVGPCGVAISVLYTRRKEKPLGDKKLPPRQSSFGAQASRLACSSVSSSVVYQFT